MTKENLIRLYDHFSFLASGKWNERNFDHDLGNEGRIAMGKMTPDRVKLIISDALANKIAMEYKYPQLFPVKSEMKVS